MNRKDVHYHPSCLLCAPGRGQCVRQVAAIHDAEMSKREARLKRQRRRPQKHFTLMVAPVISKIDFNDEAGHIMNEGNRLFQYAAMDESDGSELYAPTLVSGNLRAVQEDDVGSFQVLEYERITSLRGDNAWRRFLGVMVVEARLLAIAGGSFRKKWWGWRASGEYGLEKERLFVDNVAERLKGGGGFAYGTKDDPIFEIWKVTAQTNIMSGVSIVPFSGKKTDLMWTAKKEGFVEPPGTTMRYLMRKVEDRFPGSWNQAEEDVRKSSDTDDTQVGHAQFIGKKTVVMPSVDKLIIRNKAGSN